MSAGLISRSPKMTTVPAVMKSAMNEKKAIDTGRPQKLPIRIARSVVTKREKSPKLITTAAK